MDINGSNRGIRIARWVVILCSHVGALCFISLAGIWHFIHQADVYLESAFIVCMVLMLPSSVLMTFLVVAVMIDGRRYLDWPWWRIIWTYFAMGIPGYGILYYRGTERQLLEAEKDRRAREQAGQCHSSPIPAWGYCLFVYFAASLVAFVVLVLWDVLTEPTKLQCLQSNGASLLSGLDSGNWEGRFVCDVNTDRAAKAGEILLNSTFDDSVIVYGLSISEMGEDDHRCFSFTMEFVDENNTVARINYCESEDEDSGLGRVFGTPEVLRCDLGRVGTPMLWLDLRADSKMHDGSSPVRAPDDDDELFPKFLLPEKMFDNIAAKKGQFILLDKDGMVLDRARPKDFGYGLQDGDGN